MKTRIQPIIAPRGGLRTELPADLISDLELSDAQNIWFDRGLIKKRYGYAKFGGTQPLSGAIMGIDQFYLYSNTSFLLVCTVDDIYRWNESTSEWVKIHTTTPLFTGTDEDFFRSTHMRKSTETDVWWIVTNGVDNIKKWTGTGDLADLGGSPPKAKYITEFKEHLFLADTTESGNRYPIRVRWSDTGNPEEWSAGNASYQDLTGSDWIMGMIVFKGDYLAVLKERSVWVGYATGDDDVFRFVQRGGIGIGCSSPNTIDVFSDEVIFLGWDGVYTFNGIDTEEISTPILNSIINSLNPEELNRAFGFIVEETMEYWLCIPRAGQTYPDCAWVYNYNTNSWYYFKFPHSLTIYGFYESEQHRVINDITTAIDDANWRIDDRTLLAAMPTTLLGDKDGYVYEYTAEHQSDDGTAIQAYFDTKDFNFTQLAENQRINRLDVSWEGSALNIYYSIDGGVTWNPLATKGQKSGFSPQKIPFRTLSPKIRFRFEHNNSSGGFSFNRASIYWQKAGRID